MQMSITLKYFTTFALFYCYFVYGVNFYVVAPTLTELASLFHTTIEKICLIYTMRSLGYTLGSLSGFLFSYINRQCALIFFLTVMGITLILMPHCFSLNQLFGLSIINGFSVGSFDTAINVWLLEMWGEESNPYMQALHFTYGLGAFVAPLIAEPFLSGGQIFDDDMNSLTHDSNNTLNSTSTYEESNTSLDYLISIPYAFAGGITISGAAMVLALYIYKKYEPPKKNKTYTIAPIEEKCILNGIPVVKQTETKNSLPFASYLRKRMPPFMTVWLVLLGSMFLTFFVGMEQMHLQLLPAFAVNSDLHLSPSEAALVSSAAAAAFTIGRGLSIPISIKFRAQHIIYSNHVLMFIGTIILIIYSNTSEPMLWVGNIILGLGFSSVYASVYAFLEQQIRVTNKIGSIFVFFGGLTAALSPSLLGHYFEANPLILVWFDLVCVFLCLVLFFIIHFSIYLKGNSEAKSNNQLKTNQLLINC